MSIPKPVSLIILDGFGLRENKHGNAVAQAHKPNFDKFWNAYSHTTLRASGQAVGLPKGQMGNSEVGHLNIGAGRIVYQDLTKISKAIKEKDFFTNSVLLKAVQHAKKRDKALHLMGLLSNGGVHSHIEHLYALLELAKQEGLEKVYVHGFLDGRDVAPNSGLEFVQDLLNQFKKIGVGKLSTLQGRYYAMDRDKRWDRVQKSYDAMVYGKGILSSDPLAALKASYTNHVFDEFLLPTVITQVSGQPTALIESGDTVIFFNYRPDRAIQLSNALTNKEFNGFDRREEKPKNLQFVSMTPYADSVQGEIAFDKDELPNTFGAVVAQHHKKQLRIAETEKYPHVTFFFNGGKDHVFPGEQRILIPSPKVATYDLKPEMSIYEVTEALEKQIASDKFDSIILNFANPDMVGHSGMLSPTIKAIEATDECLGRIVNAITTKGGVCVIIADHGNADMVLDDQGNPYTAHTTNIVPCIVTKPDLDLRSDGILADVSPTLLDLMQIPQPVEMTGKSLIKS